MSALTSSVHQPRSHVAFRPRRLSPVAFLARRLARIRSLVQRALGGRGPKRSTTAAAPPSDGQIHAFAQLCRALKPRRHNLAGAPPPFLVVSRVPGEAMVATGRVQDHLLLLEPSSGRTTACGLDAVADLAERIVLMRPLSEPRQAGLRDTMFARLRPVLWELGIASVVINLLALATPLFLMTVTTQLQVIPDHPSSYSNVS